MLPFLVMCLFCLLLGIGEAVAQNPKKKKNSDQDDLFKQIEAEIKAEMEAKKAASKAAKEKAKTDAAEEKDRAKVAREEEARKAKEAEEAKKAAAAAAESRKQYQLTVEKADNHFRSREFDQAIVMYEKAAKLMPEEKYPASKITQAKEQKEKLAAAKKAEEAAAARQKQYDDAIAKADAVFQAGDHDKAKELYKQATGIKPTEKYAKSRIVEADRLIAKAAAEKKAAEEAAARDAQYKELIATADGSFKKKDYDEAIRVYREASRLKPEEKYPKDRIFEVDKIKLEEAAAQKAAEEAAALKKRFDEIVAKADALMDAKDYDKAKVAYTDAINLKSDEQYPKDQIAKADRLKAEAEAAKVEGRYKEILAQADALMKEQKYADAKVAYRDALTVKSGEQYPKDQIAEADRLEQAAKDAAEKDRQYDNLITQGDHAIKASEFDKAITAYRDAQGLKPDEAYPKEQIAKAENLKQEAEQAAIDQRYQEAISLADRLMSGKKYTEAKEAYENALTIKANEQYPKDQIAEATRLNQEEQDAAARDKEYQEHISQGDKLLEGLEYDNAKAAYEKAAAVKPDEAYPKDQMAKADRLKAEAAANAVEQQYQEIVTRGDRLMAKQSYEEAKAAYREALTVKPDESYPNEKIAEADQLMADAAEAARLAEEEAAARKAAEEEAARVEAEYNELIAQADALFRKGELEEARKLFLQAAEVKPDSPDPKNRVAEIDRQLADAEAARLADEQAQAERDNQYNALISTADQAFQAGDFPAAIADYERAAGIKPDEAYPGEQIAAAKSGMEAAEQAAVAAAAEAEKQEAERLAQERDQQYQELVSAADELLRTGDYDMAIASYERALEVKAEETYPNDQIAEARKLKREAKQAEEVAAQEAEVEAAYQTIIAAADERFDAGDYAGAIPEYERALDTKPSATYPTERIAAANERIAQAAAEQQAAEEAAKLAAEEADREKESRYQELIGAADQAFEAGNFSEAIGQYEQAAAVKPESDYPAERIAEANARQREAELAQEEAERAAREAAEAEAARAAAEEAAREKEARYQELVSAADQAFESGNFGEAIAQYERAAAVNPESDYPAERIAKASSRQREAEAAQAAAEQAARQEQAYNDLIAQADEAMNQGDYATAKRSYAEAGQIQPDAAYPDEQIAAIDQKVAEEAEQLEVEVSNLQVQGDELLASGDYSEALDQYEQALALKPGSADLAAKVESAKTMLADAERQAEEENRYLELVESAEADLAAGNYEAAKAGFREALGIRPDETVLKKKVARINTLMKAQEEPAAPETAVASIPATGGSGGGFSSGSSKFETVVFDERAKAKWDNLKFTYELAAQYPEGVTEEVYKEGKSDVTRRIVVNGPRGNEYKKVVHPWGGVYYFKNGKPIPSYRFESETK